MLSTSDEAREGDYFLQCDPRHSPPTACRRTVSGSLAPLIGVLFIFRSRYCCTIGHRGVLSLGGWAPRIHTGFHGTRATWVASWRVERLNTGLSPSMADVVRVVLLDSTFVTPWQVRAPARKHPRPRPRNAHALTRDRFRLIPFRSPLLGKSSFPSSPVATEMFQFATFPSVTYEFSYG
jgi:hypothetical protein